MTNTDAGLISNAATGWLGVYSGLYNSLDTPAMSGQGISGFYHSSTATGASSFNLLYFRSTTVAPANNYGALNIMAIRCVLDPRS